MNKLSLISTPIFLVLLNSTSYSQKLDSENYLSRTASHTFEINGGSSYSTSSRKTCGYTSCNYQCTAGIVIPRLVDGSLTIFIGATSANTASESCGKLDDKFRPLKELASKINVRRTLKVKVVTSYSVGMKACVATIYTTDELAIPAEDARIVDYKYDGSPFNYYLKNTDYHTCSNLNDDESSFIMRKVGEILGTL